MTFLRCSEFWNVALKYQKTKALRNISSFSRRTSSHWQVTAAEPGGCEFKSFERQRQFKSNSWRKEVKSITKHYSRVREIAQCVRWKVWRHEVVSSNLMGRNHFLNSNTPNEEVKYSKRRVMYVLALVARQVCPRHEWIPCRVQDLLGAGVCTHKSNKIAAIIAA